MAALTNKIIWADKTIKDVFILAMFKIDPLIASFPSLTCISKNSFQLFMWVVNKYGFITENNGILSVLNMVKNTIALMVPTIGPIELLAILDIKKPKLVTVNKEKLANTKAPT